MSRSGSLCLLLHSHMPYVEGFGTWPFGEEWLFEAAASSYVPLFEVLEEAPVTVTLTPVLADQLEAIRDGALRNVYRRPARTRPHRGCSAARRGGPERGGG